MPERWWAACFFFNSQKLCSTEDRFSLTPFAKLTLKSSHLRASARSGQPAKGKDPQWKFEPPDPRMRSAHRVTWHESLAAQRSIDRTAAAAAKSGGGYQPMRWLWRNIGISENGECLGPPITQLKQQEHGKSFRSMTIPPVAVGGSPVCISLRQQMVGSRGKALRGTASDKREA